ncbi:MAG TPA: substrate-binding domain-containing protein [Pseudonocardiaceae bacterium]|jgi:hypothetical protein|nr:substrate-binding domain-containing protein [Pseudonocardiaceae bacterium]
MARHRAPGTTASKRRVASWPIAVLVTVVLVAVAWVGWAWVGNEASKRAAAAASGCPGGLTTIQVATDPSIADIIGAETVRYQDGKPVVGDTCVKIKVTSINSAAALYALEHGWDTAKLGPKPQAWIPDSSLWTTQLTTAEPAIAGDTTQSIASSPVVLAMSTDAGKVMQSSGSVPWSQLPGLVGQDNGWATLGQPLWGRFTLALPDPANNAASMLALISMLDPATAQGQQAITPAMLGAPAVTQGLNSFADTQPNPVPTTVKEALTTLGRAAGVQSAPYTAVATTELQLYQRNLGKDGSAPAANVLDEVRPSSTTASVDFPFLPLAGDWVTADQVAVAQHFRDFLLTPPEQNQLTLSGLRTGTGTHYPNSSPGMDWGLVARASTPTDVNSYRQMVTAWTTAAAQSQH